MPRSIAVDHLLSGQSAPTLRLRPIGAAPCGLLAMVIAAMPVTPVWFWLALIVAINAVPWLLGAFWRTGTGERWRLSTAGLERLAKDGSIRVAYTRRRIEEFVLTAEDDTLFVLHKFGGTEIGRLAEMGFDRFSFFVTARRIGIPMHVLDGDQSVFDTEDASAPPGRTLHRRLLAQEAELLTAVHQPRDPAGAPDLSGVVDAPARTDAAGATDPPGDPASDTASDTASDRAPEPASDRAPEPVGGSGPGTPPSAGPDARPGTPSTPPAPDVAPSRLSRLHRRDRRLVALGAAVALLGGYMTARLALAGAAGSGGLSLEARLMAGSWLVIGAFTIVLTRRYWLRRAPLRWVVGTDGIRVRYHGIDEWRVRGREIAALYVGTGPTVESGNPEPVDGLLVLAFDHRLDVIARLPALDLDAFELAHVLSEHGFPVITDDVRRARPTDPGYGLEGLPDVFKKVPGGRLVVDDGIGWADASGETVLRLPRERLGRLELLTVNGQAWLRLYDADGDEFFTAPLSALRTSRTALRDSARRAGLPVTDAEYDAYETAVLHRAFTAGGAPAGETVKRPDEPVDPATAGGVPGSATEFLLDASRLIRRLSYLFAFAVGQVCAVVGAVLLRGDLGGFWMAWLWSASAGLVIAGLLGWRYDRDRPQLRVSTAGIASVRKRGRTQWRIDREVIGGIGVDRSNDDGRARLVVWNPAGRLVRLLPLGPNVVELRRACEKCGLPWGPPGTGAAPPPPEL
jgi:hypothetical protein